MYHCYSTILRQVFFLTAEYRMECQIDEIDQFYGTSFCWLDERTIYVLQSTEFSTTNILKVMIDTAGGNCTWELFDSLLFNSGKMSCQSDGKLYVPEDCNQHGCERILIYYIYKKVYEIWNPIELDKYSRPQINVNNDFIVITVGMGDTSTDSYIFVYSIDKVF